MAADAGVVAMRRPIPLRSRLIGFGSIYGKTMRDSRLSFLIAAGLLGGIAMAMGAAIGQVFPTPQARLNVDALIGSMPPQMVTLFGKPSQLGTMGGYMSWKYGAVFALGTALWSIMALSGTLATEARRGSLDFVAVTPFGKRRVALEKLFAHLTGLGIALVALAIATTVASYAFGEAALGDHIPPLASIGFALWVGFTALFFGGIAFALAPILGRSGAAGISSLLMVTTWVMSGMSVGGPLLVLSPFHWTVNHVALVQEYDWAGLGLVGLCGVVFLALGVAIFARRDMGITSGLRLPSMPASVLGVREPVGRAFGDQLPRALSWGIGLGLMGAMLASLVKPMADQIRGSSEMLLMFSAIFPDFDLGSAGGFMQLFVNLFYIAAGFAAATFVSKWASDETEGRLEVLLSTPVSRARWVVAGGISALASAVVMAVTFGLGIALGASSGGLDVVGPLVGSLVLGIYAAALVGLGVAIGGLWRASIAAEVVGVFVVATYLLDLLAPAFKLPSWVQQLALTAHLGQPMAGRWDVAGVVACLVLAVGGIALGAWGMGRRDVAR